MLDAQWVVNGFRALMVVFLVLWLSACTSSVDAKSSSAGSSLEPPRDYLYSEVLVNTVLPNTNRNRDAVDESTEVLIDEPGITEDLELAPGKITMQLSSEAESSLSGASLASTLAEVWGNHPNVIRAMAEIEATGFDISAARTGYYPFLSVTAAQASNDASQTTLNVIQPIWSGGRTGAEVSEAEAGHNRALAELNQVRLNLALDTADAYLNVVLAEEQGRLWRRYMLSLETLLQTITRRAELGASPSADIQTAKTRYSQAKAGLAASNSNLLRNRLHLESLTHRPANGLEWPDESYRLTEEESQRILGDKAIEAHPIGQLAIAEIELQRANVRLAKSSFFPQLSLQYSTQLEQSAGDFTPDSSTQLVFQFQTSDGFRGVNSYRAVLQRLNGAKQDLAFARRDVTDLISTAYAERAAAQEQFASQVEAAGAAVKLVDSFLRQFKVGRKAWIEVLNAHREAHEALLQISAIKKNYWSANSRLALQGMIWTRLSADAPSTYLPFEQE